MSSSYKPFPITEFKTGLFDYLEPWIRPVEAFEPLENAYIYRGTLNKRTGYSPLGVPTVTLTAITIATANGGNVYSGTLTYKPVQVGTFSINTSLEVFSDNEDGTLTSNLGGNGTINYRTGAWTINCFSDVPNLTAITATYKIEGSRMAYKDRISTGSGGMVYSGTLATIPIIPGTFAVTAGAQTLTDNGQGVLSGGGGSTGTINYTTGAWAITFGANVAVGTNIYGAYQPFINRPIMGLRVFTSETSNSYRLIALDTRRASLWDDNTQTFTPLNFVSQQIWRGDGSATTFTINANWTTVSPYTTVLAPFSISITDGTSTVIDDGAGNLSASGNITGGTVNYVTSEITVNFTAAPATTVFITLSATLTGDYFSGTSANFFNSTNWQGALYLVNAQDPITLFSLVNPITGFNGANLSRPPFPITEANLAAYINNIGTCLDVDVYNNRFLVQKPTLVNNSPDNGLFAQSIRWSKINVPTNLVADVAGNGGESSAPTDDFIQSSEFLRDQLISFFSNTTWTFKFTGNDFNPFRWSKINSSKSVNAPYGTVDYDQRITGMGNKGLIACDGVNVQRYDLNIVDEFLNINQTVFAQCYSTRFDSTNQTWMLYPSTGNNATLSDSALIYNFLEDSWATYILTMSCMGVYTNSASDARWSDFSPTSNQPTTWAEAQWPWNSFFQQALSPVLLGGGQDGVVYNLYDQEALTDNGTPISSEITSTRWNPFIAIGQKVQFGYIDIYYEINDEAVLELSFFTNNSDNPCLFKSITLDGLQSNTNNIKRVYLNISGEFLRMTINCDTQSTFKILGLVLWAREGGRLTP